jgi:Domain of unknown function (DUF4871)
VKKITSALVMISSVLLMAACTEDTTKNKIKEPQQEVSANANEVVYEIPDNDWELTPTFEHSVVFESGEEGSYTIVGSKDGIGFTGPFPIMAKEKQKYFWFYLGEENIYDKPVEVKAIKKETKVLVDVLWGPSTFYESAEVSPDSVNMPSTLKFPSAGIWKVLVYIEGELYESIVIEAV